MARVRLDETDDARDAAGKTPQIVVRAPTAQKLAWQEAAARDGADNLSDWIRDRLDEAAAGPSAVVALRERVAELEHDDEMTLRALERAEATLEAIRALLEKRST